MILKKVKCNTPLLCLLFLQVLKKVFMGMMVLALCQAIILLSLIVTFRVRRSQQTESKQMSTHCFVEKRMDIYEWKSKLMMNEAFILENETSRQICVASSVVFSKIVSKVNGKIIVNSSVSKKMSSCCDC